MCGGVLNEGATKAILKACQGGDGDSHSEVLTQRLGCCGHESERKGTLRQNACKDKFITSCVWHHPEGWWYVTIYHSGS